METMEMFAVAKYVAKIKHQYSVAANMQVSGYFQKLDLLVVEFRKTAELLGGPILCQSPNMCNDDQLV
jgi:hypothetical protein